MVENEDVSYQPNSPVEHSLITQERTAKLALLGHLLTNSTQPVVLCGSKGIGKSTLLTAFQQRLDSSWFVCSLQGRADMSFESLQTQLFSVCPTSTPDNFFEQLAVANKKLLLLIDDSGFLPPYLITLIIDYAAQHPLLKVVFVLSHDELAVKNCSDRAIESCHIIEVPPLSEQQCGDFLQHLIINTGLKIPLDSITERMVADVYQQSHGIPEKIIAHLPILAHPPQHGKKPWWLLILGLLGGIAWLVLKYAPNIG
jgi:DamX protein